MADKHPAKHLEQYKWKKGQASPNPRGRPKSKLPSETLRDMLEAEFGGSLRELQKSMPEPWRSQKEITVQDALCWILLRKSLTAPGDLARKEVFDRTEGKPLQKIAGPDSGPIQVENVDLKQFSEKDIRILREIRAKLEKK